MIHHSSYIVCSGSTKMYKDEERSGLEFSTYLLSSLLQTSFGLPLYKELYGCKCWSPLYWNKVGRKQRWGLK